MSLIEIKHNFTHNLINTHLNLTLISVRHTTRTDEGGHREMTTDYVTNRLNANELQQFVEPRIFRWILGHKWAQQQSGLPNFDIIDNLNIYIVLKFL